MPPIQSDPLFRRMRRHAAKRALAQPQTPLSAYQQFLRTERAMVLRYHKKGDSGRKVAQAMAVMMDTLLEALFARALAEYRAQHADLPFPVSMLALGGYGRAELCPHSDVDIMFLFPDTPTDKEVRPLQEKLTGVILYLLWDMGLKVGHSTRNLRDAMKQAAADVQNKNAMLESRLIAGDTALFDRFQKQYRKFLDRDQLPAYMEDRLRDQKERHARFGNSVFLQEPDIKNGVGGLRDYQNILWIVRLKLGRDPQPALISEGLLDESELADFSNAYDFLLRVRNELHFQTSRPNDTLDLERQPLIAESLGYPGKDLFERVEWFMRDYYRAAQCIARTSRYLENKLDRSVRPITFKAVLRSRRAVPVKRVDGFVIEDGLLSATNTNVFNEDPERLIRVFRHAQQFNVPIDIDLQRLMRRCAHLLTPAVAQRQGVNRAFRFILQSVGEVYPMLVLMNETGILQRFLPEWASLECRVQHEYYHRYTADIHTLQTIQQLDRIFNLQDKDLTGKYHSALHQTEMPGLLYLILLLHDIGKGVSVQGHAERGADMAKPILHRLEVNPDLHEKILAIIRLHLEMARFWQHFDVDDPRTAQSFAKRVESPELLRLLYVHTFCDACGTAEGLWNSYKDSLHSRLFNVTLAAFGEQPPAPEQLTMIPKETIRAKVPDLHEDEIEAHYNLMPERYFIYNNIEEVALHLRMVNELLRTIAESPSMGSLEPIVDWHDDLSLSMTVVNIVTWDRAGLFYKLAGAFSVAGLSIVSSKAITRADHITIDTFYVCEMSGGVVQDAGARRVFGEHLRKALLENLDLMPAIEATAKRLSKPSYLRRNDRLRAPIPATVDVYHELSLRRTIIEIQANDHLGLLYRLTKAIYDHGFDITFARVATERSAAIDTFYIEKIDRRTQDDASDLLALRESLAEIVIGSTSSSKNTRTAAAG